MTFARTWQTCGQINATDSCEVSNQEKGNFIHRAIEQVCWIISFVQPNRDPFGRLAGVINGILPPGMHLSYGCASPPLPLSCFYDLAELSFARQYSNISPPVNVIAQLLGTYLIVCRQSGSDINVYWFLMVFHFKFILP